MKIFPLVSLSFVLLFAACSTGVDSTVYHPDIGPFDENGDYVEALADAPVRKRFFRRSTPKPEEVEKPVLVAKKTTPKPKPVVQVKPKPEPVRIPVSAPAPKPVVVASKPKPVPVPVTRTVTAAPKPKPKPVVVSKPKPKPKAVVKPKPKPKPKYVYHVVKPKDTLWALSQRYGASVSAIQRANGLRGTTIVSGKTLKIPK
ncbi:MAG: LysM peptidoglycan-binding domain-containing protein [Verrucomicrobiota bacterium]